MTHIVSAALSYLWRDYARQTMAKRDGNRILT